MNQRRLTKRIIAVAVLIGALGVLLFTGQRYGQLQQAYQVGDRQYEHLRAQVIQPKTTGEDDPSGDSATQRTIDFQALKEINADVIGWLRSPGTPIDYPVMKATDYQHYLSHLPDGTYNANGSLFLDFNNAPDFSERLSIIYGHNMQSGSMFGTLTRYKEQSYFEEHPSLYLYTADGEYRIDLLYGCVVGAGVWRDRAFMYEVNLESLLAFASSKSTFITSESATDSDRLIVLSTCSYEFDDARYIVIGVLRPLSVSDTL